MKKIILLLLLSVFIFSKKSIGQIEPRMTEKVVETFTQNKFWKSSHQYFSYLENGDTLSVIKKSYDSEEELLSWIGDFFEYDIENRLVKKNNKRYNSEVDLWISNYWENYFYDDNGCLIREEVYYNVGGFQYSWHYVLGENCRKEEGRATGGTDYDFYLDYIYPDDNNSIISSRIELVDDEWKEMYRVELIRNNKNDVIKRMILGKNDFLPPDDTAYLSIRTYEYIYNEDFFTGRLTSKIQKYYSNIANVFTSPFNLLEFQFERQFDYEYYCDGTVSMETLSIVGEPNPQSRTLYFYEGKNDCFDFEQDLDMTILPNPSFGEIEIQSLIFESGDTELQVFTASGQLVFEKNIPSRSHYQNVDLDVLGNGIYIIHLRSGKHFSSSKLVIVK